MRWIGLVGVVGSLVCATPLVHAQGACQKALNNVAQLERDAATQPRSQAQYMLQAAQQYRNYYNQNCTGSGGGGYSGGSGGGVDKGAAIQGILGNLANMAAIMERSRLRQESEAREQALQGEIERLEREEAENRRKAEAEWQAKADKDADDRRRAAIPNPFLNADGRIPESENPFAPTGEVVIDNPFAGPPTGVSANCARNSNPSMCELLEKTDAYDKRMGRKLAEGSKIVIGARGTSVPALQSRMPAEATIKVESCGADVCIYRTTAAYRKNLYRACAQAGGKMANVAGVTDGEKACRLAP